jgi:hypothetical protein
MGIGNSATVSSEQLASRYINFVRSHSGILKQSIVKAIHNGDDIPRVLFEDPAVAYKMDLCLVLCGAASAIGKFNSLNMVPLLPLLHLLIPEFPESERAWRELDWEIKSFLTETINDMVERFSSRVNVESLVAFYCLKKSEIPGAISLSTTWGALLRDVGTLVTSPQRLAAARWETSELRNELSH